RNGSVVYADTVEPCAESHSKTRGFLRVCDRACGLPRADRFPIHSFPQRGVMKRACVCVAAAVVWSAGVTPRAAAPTDVVIYASDVAVVQGNWTRVTSA